MKFLEIFILCSEHTHTHTHFWFVLAQPLHAYNISCWVGESSMIFLGNLGYCYRVGFYILDALRNIHYSEQCQSIEGIWFNCLMPMGTVKIDENPCISQYFAFFSETG